MNRVFEDKPGGLVVDYIGMAAQLKEALATYTDNKGKGRPTVDIAEALAVLFEHLGVAGDLLHPVDWSGFRKNALDLMPVCLDHILGLEDGKRRFCDTVLYITKSFALCGTHQEAQERSEEVAFLQVLRASLIKQSRNRGDGKGHDESEFKLRQLISEAVISEGVTDIFEVAGLDKPDISVLSDEFLAEIRDFPHKNLGVELLERLLRDDLRSRFRTNIVKHRKFSELL